MWQTGQERPSANLMKVSGGVREDEGLRLNLSTLNAQDELQRQSELKLAEQAREQDAVRQQEDDTRAIVLPAEEAVKLRPEELNPE
ncbi:conjugal transfer protein TraI, partial [Enterobacter hormaechei]